MGIFCMLLLSVSVSSAATPFNPSRPPTREQVLDHFLGATYGQYYWNAGSEEIPFYPKGFPNWKMSIYDVKSILGEPNYIGKTYGIETLEYGRFAIMTKDNKFVGVKSGIMSHLVLDRYAGNGSFMWKSDAAINLNPYEKNDNSPLNLISSSKIFSTRFATSSSRSSKYAVIAWQNKEGENAGSYVALKEIAQDLGIVR
jgi:hypothetical protein